MTMLPETWLAAQRSIASAIAKPYLHAEEKGVGQRYSAELDEAIRRYGVGGAFFHEGVDPAITSFGPITTAPAARDFVASLRLSLNGHFGSYVAHWRPTNRVIAPDTDVNALANAIKAAHEAHRTDPSVHFNDDTLSVVSAPNATNDATLIVLAEALRVATLQHVGNAGKIVFKQTTVDNGQYQQALQNFQASRAKSLELIAYVERVARAAQIAVNFSFSGSGMPWETTPYGKLAASFENVPKIRDRIQNIWEAGAPYTEDPYVLDVAMRALALLGGGPNEPTPPAPPGQTTLVVQGVVSSAAEAALAAAIAKVSKFAAAAAVQ